MVGSWTTADYALIVSLCSAAISLFSLGWNVWSKFIYPRPRIRASAYVVAFDEATRQVRSFPRRLGLTKQIENEHLVNPAICIYVANHGPEPVKLSGPLAARASTIEPSGVELRGLSDFVSYPWDIPISASEADFDQPLQPGADRTIFLPLLLDEFKRLAPIQYGFLDAFGRRHLCPKKDVVFIGDIASRYYATH